MGEMFMRVKTNLGSLVFMFAFVFRCQTIGMAKFPARLASLCLLCYLGSTFVFSLINVLT